MAVEAEMDAVFKSSRADKDPVSGNEVPTGSLPEEVRDDIPAQLSEGEYVVPADVVRYYGVKFFEDLRTEAKAGWNSMEENGRIGGEPVGMEMGDDELPFDLAELQMVDDGEEQPEMYSGGYMRGYAPGGYQPSMSFGGKYGDSSVTIREYVGPNGEKVFIQFIGETPLTAIPEGYVLAETAAEQVSEQVAEQTTSNNDDNDDTPPVDMPDPIDWNEATVDQFNDYLDNKDSTVGKVVKTGAAVLGGPLVYGFMKMATKHQDKRVRAGLEAQLENMKTTDPEYPKYRAILDRIEAEDEKRKENDKQTLVEKSGIFGGKSSLYEDLEDRDGDGVNFGDTWLGDLLGFDEDGFGVDGDSLADSLSGSRRDGETSVPSATSSGDDSSNLWDNVVKSGNDDNSSIGKDAGDGMTWVKDPTGNSNAVVRVRSDSTAAKGQKAAMEGWDE